MPTPQTITWAYIGDLHAGAADGWQGIERLGQIVAELNGPIGRGIDFVFLPGDNADRGRREEYDRVLAALAPLELPWRAIPGDHDVEPGNLSAYEAAIPPANRPPGELIAGHRCIFFDIVSAGQGGPDFRLSVHDRQRLSEQFTQARAEAQPALVMRAIPGGLAADRDEVARVVADRGAAFVDEGPLVPIGEAGDGWTVDLNAPQGLHRVDVSCGEGHDVIELLVRPAGAIPKRPPAYALGRECHRIGAWPERGILGTRLGPNANDGQPS